MAEPHGLTEAEAAARLEREGPNAIARARPRGPARILLEQLGSPLIWLLLSAVVLSFFMGHVPDALAILIIVILNAVIGFLQEYRAERAVLALRSLTAPRARVFRDGRSRVVPATEVVRGDVLMLEEGDLVAADARLLEANRLTTNEAPLTGESLPVEKSTVPTAPDTPLAERTDQVFMGTAVATGTGRAQVQATGMKTELGHIARLLETAEVERTPLQNRLRVLGRTILYLCLGEVALVTGLGLWHRVDLTTLILTAISFAVAVVPEAMPAIVTIALAIGVQRMSKRHVLVRHMAAVETLGTTTVICTDKTGTLTTGQMAVREIWGPDPDAVLYAAAACSDAELARDGGRDVGDPTEVAMLRAARDRGITRERLERENPRRAVNPFDSTRKRMSILRADGALYVKGALEPMLPLCTEAPPGVAEENSRLAARGLRVLGVAVGHGQEEQHLRLLGLVGIADPPRPDAIAAVAAARSAGIIPVMITGDHPATARAIAHEMGILLEGEDPAERIHARATAEDKLQIVRDWKRRGAIVAMTGDGVNDAPALREAHIGIAMGLTGTEVTREASDVVLADDDFASIVAAVREGRTIFDNIRRTLVYLLSSSTAKVVLMIAASLIGWPIPLLPLQLLYTNLITDGLPALALVFEPSTGDVLAKPPRPATESILGGPQWLRISLVAVLEAVVVLGAYAWALAEDDVVHARTMAFTVITLAELFRAFAARSNHQTFWQRGAGSNLYLVGIVAVSTLLTWALHAFPPARTLFGLAVFTERELAVCLVLSLVPVTVMEVWKLVLHLLHRGTSR